MRCSAVLLSVAITLTLGAGVSAHERAIKGPHVRPLNQDGIAVMVDAQKKSETVRALFDKLGETNVIAYVYVAPAAEGKPESALSFIGASKVARFVLISIANHTTSDRRIELLGHELQHAVEVAGKSWVTNNAQFRSLMALIGWRDPGKARGYETTAATSIESRVRREIHGVAGPQ